MRKCHIKNIDKKATFQGFFQYQDRDEAGAYAIIELEDGSVTTCNESNLVFDAPQNVVELAATDSQQIKAKIAAQQEALSSSKNMGIFMIGINEFEAFLRQLSAID